MYFYHLFVFVIIIIVIIIIIALIIVSLFLFILAQCSFFCFVLFFFLSVLHRSRLPLLSLCCYFFFLFLTGNIVSYYDRFGQESRIIDWKRCMFSWCAIFFILFMWCVWNDLLSYTIACLFCVQSKWFETKKNNSKTKTKKKRKHISHNESFFYFFFFLCVCFVLLHCWW